MSLKTETVNKLKGFGFDVDKLIAAIKADTETEYVIPDVTVFTADKLEERDNNMKEAGKKDAEGSVKSTLIKELGKKLNVELKSDRIGDLASEIQELTNKTGDEKVKLLQQQVAALSADKTTLTQQVEQEKTRAAQAAFDNELIGYFPPTRGGDLTDAQRLLLIKADLQFETVEGKVVVKKGGAAVLDDQTKAPKAVKDVLTDYFKEKPSLVGVAKDAGGGSGGRGGGDNFGGGGAGGAKKYSQVKEDWQKANPEKNITSPEFMDHVGKIATETTDFDWNS